MDNTKGKTIQIKDNTRRESIRKEQRKRKLIRVIFILFSLLYLPALWKWVFHGNIETSVLHSGIMEMKISAEGVFIRSEVPINAVREGIIIPAVNQGERVPNKYSFAKLVDKSSQQTLQRIESMERDIIRQTTDESPNILDGDPAFHEKVQNEVNKLTELALEKNIIPVDAVKSTLEQLLYQRNREIFKKQDDRLYLQKNKEELEKLQNSLTSDAINVQAEFSGLVVWDNIPYDEKFKSENINNLALEDLFADDNKQKEYQIQSIGVGDSFNVEKDQVFARLVNNEKSWFVCAVEHKNAEYVKPGNSILLKVEGIDTGIGCNVESIQPTGDKLKVIMSFNESVEKTIYLRYAKSELIFNNIQGIKVPVRSLTNFNVYDSTADIIVVRFDRASVKRVKVLARQDAFAIIEAVADTKETNPVRVFDVYVVNPQNISEGQVIE